MKHQREFKLPPCGMYIGSGIYNADTNYLICTGRVHTTWVPQRNTWLEMIDKVIADNQGNLLQLWPFSGELSPFIFAQHHALEDIGIAPPEPDWVNGKNLTVDECFDREQYADRLGAGIFKFVQQVAAKGLYSTLIYAKAHPQWSQRLQEAGDSYLGYDFGECFTYDLREVSIAGKDLRAITLQQLADDLVRQVRASVEERHSGGWGNVMATSSDFHLDYEILGGADIPLVEDFAFSHLNISSALSRGLYRQYGLPTWGSHLAHEHYSWIPYSSPYKFPLLRAAMYQKYMAGCKILLNESGNWFLQAQLVTDSPMFDTPRIEPGGPIHQRKPEWAIPHLEAARESYQHIDYNSPIARAYRKEISDFYDFVKEKGTPAGQPESTLAIIKGNNDLSSHEYHPNAPIAGAFALADENPNWFNGAPERGWNIVKKVFYPRPEVLAPHLNRFLSGTPYGQVDIVSFAQPDVSAQFLSANYKALLFSGWNTATLHQYETLTQYVRDGGVLFIAIPHLSTNITRDYNAYTVDELVNNGDFSELCGVKVRGRGRRFYWATAPDRKGELGFEFPRRFGIMTTCMGDIEITDPDAEILAVDDEEMYPVLLRRKLGQGTVYFLNSWAYPGAMDADEGPGSTLGSPGLIGYIYRHIARIYARGTVWITDDGQDAGAECDYIAHSYFPESGQVCLHNIDFDHPHHFFLHSPTGSEEITLRAGEFRMRSV